MQSNLFGGEVTLPNESSDAVPQFIEWYKKLQAEEAKDGYDDVIHAQLTMLGAVLWRLLPINEYHKLTSSKKGLKA